MPKSKKKKKLMSTTKSSPVKINHEKKYSIDNEKFFPTLVSVKKDHEELVRQQKLIEKTNGQRIRQILRDHNYPEDRIEQMFNCLRRQKRANTSIQKKMIWYNLARAIDSFSL